MKKITPFLWFDNNAEQAVDFYCSIFKDSKKGDVSRMGDGSIMVANFTLMGREYMALNGGPHFTLNEAFSLFVTVDTQEEVDELWRAFTKDGGAEQQCGWVKDRFGVSWQIVPKALGELMGGPDPVKSSLLFIAISHVIFLPV